MNGLIVNNMITIVLGITVISFMAIQIIINRKNKRRLEIYMETIEKLNEYDNVGEAFRSIYQKLDQVNDFCGATKQRCEETENKSKKCIQKIGFVKYSTHDTGKNELSFAVAMLDENNDGVILNEVHTRTASNIYGKQIEGGKCTLRLSDEETLVLEKAMKDKEFVKR